MDSGGAQRSAILKDEAERHFLEPLRNHGWNAAIERASPSGEFLIISAKRGCHEHKVALLYSTSTDNLVYKTLVATVRRIIPEFDEVEAEKDTRPAEQNRNSRLSN